MSNKLTMSMEKEYTTHSVQETIELGSDFAFELEPGDVVCLKGELGSGKTHFVKGIAKGMGIPEEEVQSPTYTLIHEYDTDDFPLYHFDCYRINSPEEALEIGAEEYFYGEGVSAIEWAEKISELIPPDAIWLEFKINDNGSRKIVTIKKG